MRFVLVIETGADREGPAFSIGQAAPVTAPGPAPAAPVSPAADPEPAEPPRPPAPPPPLGVIEEGWSKLLEAQQRFAKELGKKPQVDRERQMWIGGAMAMFALLAGENEAEVGRRLGAEVPTPTWHGIPVQPAHELPEPVRHAGAQRSVEADDPLLGPDPGLAGFVTGGEPPGPDD